MSHAYDALVNRLQQLDRWISETEQVRAIATEPETRQQIEDDLARWHESRKVCASFLERISWLNRAASAMFVVLGISVVGLFLIPLQSINESFRSVIMGIDVLTMFASLVGYILAIAARDSVARSGEQIQFSLRSMLIVMTVIAVMLGTLAWLSRG
jgi:hypothetical protein